MLKVGVIGAGHLGKIHLKLWKQIPGTLLVGFHDHHPGIAEKVASEFGIKFFDTPQALMDQCDAIDIVTPTLTHYQLASEALSRSRHIFIEKPVTTTVAEAASLVEQVAKAGVKGQVGHVERFNPAFLAAREYLNQPMFIETHRLAEFNPRGTDVSVVHDLMIHDIDIVLSTVNSPVRSVLASGVAVVSDTPDIANARIEFENGCVANLTASRISLKNMRKTRYFQRDAYIAVDFLKKKTEVVRLKNVTGEPGPLDITIDLGNGKGTRQIYFDSPKVEESNAIQTELELFTRAILRNEPVPVSIEDGYRAVDVAHQVMEKLNASLNVVV